MESEVLTTMNRPLCFALPIILGCQSLIGCTSWNIQSRTPQAIVEEVRPGKVQVKLKDGEKYVVENLSIASDTLNKGVTMLTGRLESSDSRNEFPGGVYDLRRQRIPQQLNIPVSAIDWVATRRISPEKTVGLVIGAVACLVPILQYLALTEGRSNQLDSGY